MDACAVDGSGEEEHVEDEQWVEEAGEGYDSYEYSDYDDDDDESDESDDDGSDGGDGREAGGTGAGSSRWWRAGSDDDGGPSDAYRRAKATKLEAVAALQLPSRAHVGRRVCAFSLDWAQHDR
eukprot:SAG22_NODE_8811_length_628_cov_1.200378_1_plen_122_part_10